MSTTEPREDWGLFCTACGSNSSGSFTHHSVFVGRGTHISTSESCPVTKMHCMSCCKEREQ